MEFSVLIFKNQ